jgi:hypothetical protein
VSQKCHEKISSSRRFAGEKRIKIGEENGNIMDILEMAIVCSNPLQSS